MKSINAAKEVTARFEKKEDNSNLIVYGVILFQMCIMVLNDV